MAAPKGMFIREKSPNWKGGRTKGCNGYMLVKQANHPRADSRGYVYEHVIIAEQKIGRLLNGDEIPHHINGIKDDNRPENIHICKNKHEHQLIHGAMNAVQACGNANWRRCYICKQCDDPINLDLKDRHKECHNRQAREYRKKIKDIKDQGRGGRLDES